MFKFTLPKGKKDSTKISQFKQVKEQMGHGERKEALLPKISLLETSLEKKIKDRENVPLSLVESCIFLAITLGLRCNSFPSITRQYIIEKTKTV